MTASSLWNQTGAPMYTQPPKKKIQQIMEEPPRDIATWRVEATEKADWEVVTWINEQQQRTQEPIHLFNC